MKRVKIALAVLAVALVGVIVWQAWPPPEPVYKGRTLTSWLEDMWQLYNYGDGVTVVANPEAQEAIRHIGNNALPTLLRLLRANDSIFKAKVTGLLARQHVVKVDYRPPAVFWNRLAADSFKLLGSNAQSAVPTLIQIANEDISSSSRAAAIDSLSFVDPEFRTIEALGHIGRSAKEAVACLLQCVTNADWRVRYYALRALGQIHAEPNRVVPVLMNGLHDPDLNVQLVALASLIDFGPDAKIAVPALVELLKTPLIWWEERDRAAAALKAIDPVAAAKAGITNAP